MENNQSSSKFTTSKKVNLGHKSDTFEQDFLDNKDTFKQEFEQANLNYIEDLNTKPKATKIVYKEETNELEFHIQYPDMGPADESNDFLSNTSFILTLNPDSLQGLKGADPKDIKDVALSIHGLSCHWPSLDVDFSIPGIVQGIYGTKKWMDSLKSD